MADPNKTAEIAARLAARDLPCLRLSQKTPTGKQRRPCNLNGWSWNLCEACKVRPAVAAGYLRLVEALEAWQIRLAFLGMPQEPKDWSEPVRLTEQALAATEEADDEERRCACPQWTERCEEGPDHA